ncbi:BolA family protein [Pusillimonas minor]|uniref:BolA family transcriptional regulator n=1 Tax=Pusillimonas minor TaxID=2697024 RepID=A0A842HL97_9BURK|nr:BolA family protein [Pusillimonas minor]MBC2768704.1 BolA family transcriptional regulator [Pusillimonas minor]
MTKERIDLVHSRLQALEPTQLDIIDESHLHAGHAGSESGASHLRVIITSPQFEGLRALQRHRLVYDQVSDLIPFPIHALAIVANTN